MSEEKKLESYVINGYRESVASLPIYPTDGGITPEQLQKVFDARTDEEVSTSINGVIEVLIGAYAAGQIGARDGSVQECLDSKVEKAAGMGLSETSYTAEEQAKLSGIEEGAQVNAVHTVAGKTGEVSLSKDDVGLNNVDNTKDVDKPVSEPQREELDKKATKVNPEFTGAINIDGVLFYKAKNDEGEVVIYRPMSENLAPESILRIGYDFISLNGNHLYHSGNLKDLLAPGQGITDFEKEMFMQNTGLNVVLGDIETALDDIIALESEYIGGGVV